LRPRHEQAKDIPPPVLLCALNQRIGSAKISSQATKTRRVACLVAFYGAGNNSDVLPANL
jgi:hypothetical protein